MSEYVIWLEDKRADVVDTDEIYKVSRPAHLREPIVRCRDCKHRKAGLEPPFYCLRLGAYKEFNVSLDGFCKWGESKEVSADD